MSASVVNTYILMALCLLVAGQILAKVVIFRRVFEMLEKVEQMLRMAEAHGHVTDSQRERINHAMSVVVPTVKRAVDEVPEKVADKVVEKLDGRAAGDSDRHTK